MNKQKENIIEIVQKIDNENLLEALEKLLFQYQFELETSTPMSEEDFALELSHALKDIDTGRFVKVNELEKEVHSWKEWSSDYQDDLNPRIDLSMKDSKEGRLIEASDLKK